MKNIHLIPTDKPSRLYLGKNGNFVFGIIKNSIQSKNNDFTNQNIYITSDEEIKEGDYVTCNGVSNTIQRVIEVNKDDELELSKGHCLPRMLCKKIILTTDQDLIKDGVQAIDDEFLEWFVKNPNREEVEVQKWSSLTECGYSYHIIIPKEESKKKHIVMLVGDKVNEEPKQETLEEASLLSRPIHLIWDEDERYDCNEEFREEFKKGVKWQLERSYSQLDVVKILSKYETLSNKDFNEFFEQFKKK